MRLLVSLILITTASTAWAQESRFHADLRGEVSDLKESCSSFSPKEAAGCAYTVATDAPLHLAIGSLAPQNGMGFGLAFTEHWTPNEQWRIGWNADAVGTPNGSYRAGFYMKLVPIPRRSGRGVVAVRPSPIYSFYAQTISLDEVPIVAHGEIFRERQTITGASVVYPLNAVARSLNMSAVGGLNGRFVRTRSTDAALNESASFVQFEEGLRIRPSILNDRLRLNYLASLQQFVTSADHDGTFHRWGLDLKHEFGLYRTVSSRGDNSTNGPDDCAESFGGRCPPLPLSRNREGAVSFRLLVSKSVAATASNVPFYFQPTLGGSDINGQRLLSAYDDYQSRGTNLFALQETLEHSVWGPLGLFLLAEQGTLTPEHAGLTVHDLSRSFGVGITLRAGGFPMVNLTFAWGPGTHHIIGTIDPALLGGSSRPSLQ